MCMHVKYIDDFFFQLNTLACDMNMNLSEEHMDDASP